MSEAYFARMVGTHDPVGIFVVDSRSALFWLIDECTDPHRVEVARAPVGGLIWTGQTKTSWPTREEDDSPSPQEPADMSESWVDALCEEGQVAWTRLERP